MIERIRVLNKSQETLYAPQDVPLRIGAGASCQIRLDDGADDVLASIGLTEGVPHVHASEESSVFYNNELITRSRWLYDGDVLYIGHNRIRCELTDDELVLRVQKLHASEPPEQQSEVSEYTVISQPQPQLDDLPSDTSWYKATSRNKKRRRIILFSILGIFVTLLILAAFVFSAKSVAIRVKPEPDSMSISGGLPKFALVTRYLMLSGEYEMHATKQGYRPLDKPFTVTSEQNQMVIFVMEALPGYLDIQLVPAVGGEVWIDNKRVASLKEGKVEVERGTHQLEVRTERYKAIRQLVDVDGAGKTQTFKFNLEPAWANISITSEPAGAEVWVDEELKGVTSDAGDLIIEMKEGTRQLRLKLDDYADLQQVVEVVGGEDQHLPIMTLMHADGHVQLESTPSGASVSLDGDYMGQTPLEFALSSEQSHKLSLSKAGYDSRQSTLELEPGENKKLNLALTADNGVLVIDVTPADAKLYIDGQTKSTELTEKGITLSTQPHRLDFRREGYQPKTVTVTPKSGLAREITIQLESIESSTENSQVESAEPDKKITTAAEQVMLLVQPGDFEMGVSRREPGRRSNETLQPVQLTKPFYVMEKEVTNAQFRAFKKDHDSGMAGQYSLNAADQPVANVSWQEAAAYANWLSSQDGLEPAYRSEGDKWVQVQPMTNGYRLPTEAEWVWIARFRGRPAAPRYPWGQGFPPNSKIGNYADRSANTMVAGAISSYDDGQAVAAPVGSYRANLLGFYDLDGNVSEWMHDVYDSRPLTRSVLLDPLGSSSGDVHAVRGASWYMGSRINLRLAYRDYSAKPRMDLGFRLARYTDYEAQHD